MVVLPRTTTPSGAESAAPGQAATTRAIRAQAKAAATAAGERPRRFFAAPCTISRCKPGHAARVAGTILPSAAEQCRDSVRLARSRPSRLCRVARRCRQSSWRVCSAASTRCLPFRASISTVEEGEIYGFLGPNGAGKTTTVRMLTTLLLPTGGRATVAGHDVVKQARAVRASIGVALQEAALDPLMTGRELIRLQATLQGLPGRRGQAARRRPARAGRPRRGRRPPRRRLLGRDAAPARPRRGAGPRAAGALPRRADHRPRPGQPQDDLGGGAGAQRRGHDRLPHHPVPGGGRPARRQRRDHRQRQDRRRRHAGLAQGRDRQPAHPAAARRGLDRRGRGSLRPGGQAAAARRRPHGAGRGRERRRRHPQGRAGARRGRDRGRVAGAGPPHPRRRLRRQDRPPPGEGRAGRRPSRAPVEA